MTSISPKPDGRRYKRIVFKRPIKSRAEGWDVLTGHLAQDLSEGGVRFISTEFIPVNTEIMVQIQLKDQSRIIEIPGRVVWVRVNPASDNYQFGLEFADTMAVKRAIIGEHVQSAAKEKK